MILILLSWCYIFFISLSIGIQFSKLTRIPPNDVVITTVLGLFSVTVLASFWAIFGPIALHFHLILLLISIVLAFKNKNDFKTVILEFKIIYNRFPIAFKFLFVLSSLLILAQSATLPFIIDNETYYIQTIKWLNEYGFVPGLANLHLFFGQTSGWHITQSAFNFSFLLDRFNDLNGFCLLLGNFWAFGKLHSYFSTKNRLDLVFGLLPLTYTFLFQFVNAPSPDLPVYIFGLLLFSLYLDKENFTLIFVLALFLVYIKISAAIFLLFPAVLFLKNYDVLKSKLITAIGLSVMVFVFFIIKNSLLTGYPFFPLTFASVPNIDYAVPRAIMDFFFSKSIMHSFYMPFGTFEESSILDLVKHYFLYNGLGSFLANVTLFLIVFSPLVICNYFSKTKIWHIYIAFFLLLILLIFSSPQYRFYIYFTLFFGLLWISIFLRNEKIILFSISGSLVLVTTLVFVPISFGSLTDNKSLGSNSTFQFKNIVFQELNTNSSQNYKLLQKQNLNIKSQTSVR